MLRNRNRARSTAAAVGGLVFVCLLVVFFHHAIASFAVEQVAGVISGTNVRFASMQLGRDRASFTGLKVESNAGEPIAGIDELDVGYNLRDILPGGSRAYGIRDVTIVRPAITIIHHADGSYNIPIPKSSSKPSSGGPPLNLSLNVRDGSLTVLDATRVDPIARRLSIDRINVRADLNTAGRSRYAATLAYRDGERAYPIDARGDIDPVRGFMLQGISIARLPLAQLAAYATNNTAIHMYRGELDGLHVNQFALAAAHEPMRAHITGVAFLRNAAIAVHGLSMPVRNVHGRFDITDDGITTEGIAATLGRATTRLTGGIYNLAHPTARFALDGRADLAQFRRLVTATALPIAGSLNYRVLIEGPAMQPTAFVSVAAPHLSYNNVPLQGTRGLIAANARAADIVGFQTNYGAIHLATSGHLGFARSPGAVRVLLRGSAPAQSIPFAAGLVPGMTLAGVTLATAEDPRRIDTRGVIYGTTRSQVASALFHVDSTGTGNVGPFFIGNERSSLYGRIAIDHPHGRTTAFVNARNFHIRPARAVQFASFRTTALPTLTGDLDANLVGIQDGMRFGLAGSTTVRDARIASMRVASADARFGGTIGDLEVRSLRANGPWGMAHASATVLTGTHGAIAQLRNAAFATSKNYASPIDGLDATVGVRSNAIDVYAARARVGNGNVLAAGSFGNGGTLSVAATGVDLGALHRLGVPLQSGSASAAATLQGTAADPRINGAFVLGDARYQSIPLGALAAFSLHGGRLAVRATTRAGYALARVNGTVSGLRKGIRSSRYDLNASVRGLDLNQVAAIANPKLAREVAGSADADLRIAGSAAHPSILGSISAPEGSVYGEGFRAFRSRVSGTANALALDAGNVAFGTTTLGFSGYMGGPEVRFALRAPRVDLADFNDFFDAGDTFAGRGHLNVAFAAGDRLQTSGDASFRNARFRQYSLGETTMQWDTAGRTVHGALALGSENGHASVAGSALVPGDVTAENLSSAVMRSDVDLTARARDMALGAWLPLFGVNAPVTGKLNADATVRGTYPDLAIAANAQTRNATFGKFSIENARVAGRLSGDRGTIDEARLEMPYLLADASGSFGLRPDDTLDVTAHASSSDIGQLAATATGVHQHIGGTAHTTLRVRGTRMDPRVSDAFTLTSLRYDAFNVPRIIGNVDAKRNEIALRGGEVDLERGRLLASGTIPLDPRNFAIDPRAPISADVKADDVELSNFATLLPQGSKLSGRVDGSVTAAGRTTSPHLGGLLTLAGGSYSGPLDKDPITDMSSSIALSGTSATVRQLHANVGGGTFDAHGRASLPNLRNPASVAFDVEATAQQARINSPQYYSGQIDADVHAMHVPADRTMVTGSITASKARIPLSALYNPSPPKASPAPPPDVGFNLAVNAGRDVRVQNAAVDIGATGGAILGGTLASPTLNGAFTSTGGTVSFYRNFRVRQGRVAFSPDSGLVPDVNAVATTTIDNPATDVTIHAKGPATDMNVDFASDPTYSREQILGLLVGAQQFGAVQGVATTGGGKPMTATSAAQSVAFSQANQVFTRNLLEPLSSSLGGALGLNNLEIYNDIGSGFGASAEKRIGQHVTARTTESLGYPRRTSVDLRYGRKDTAALSFRLFQQQQVTVSPTVQSATIGNDTFGIVPLESQVIQGGTSGFNLSYQRRYW